MSTVIENPVINFPFAEPDRHFKFTEDGITDEIVQGRRPSAYFIPIAKTRKKGGQLSIESEWTQDRIEPNPLVNRIRQRVDLWRQGGYVGVTPTTARLLAYWTNPEREKKLFFCQIEAMETIIYITEAAKKFGDVSIENDLRAANDTSNPGLPRYAMKMATGSGKTVVMAMIIAWQALNKFANPQDARFSDTFLIIAPGITIRDRLRVLFPNDPSNYYRQRNVLDGMMLETLQRARILITNFHGFQLREKGDAAKLTKTILGQGTTGAFTESPDQMVRRVCRELGTKKNIVVINDEAHHCYRRKPDTVIDDLKGDEKKEAQQREEDARIWISGVEAVKKKIGVRAIYDLSATPFFLSGSGYREGTLFPWVISDFSLIDAIESGIVKVPRVPVSDNSMVGEQPTYRDLWLRIRDDLPKKGRKTDAVGGEPKLPPELQGALHSLYSNYEKYYQIWLDNTDAQAKGLTPPVFIVVCNNTNVSKLVFDYISGWEKLVGEEIIVQAGALKIFRNDDERGGWIHRPNTILVDSQQLESGLGMSEEFKKIAAREIDEFKVEYRNRFPGRDADKLSDEDLLREVMNTVGKTGKLGENVKCVVSVSMLTEGWDANTCTHVLGVRAFGTQLLCEQVVGRALRRTSYAVNEEGTFDAEYAEVYGVPFSFIPSSGGTVDPKPGPMPTRVRALDDRISCEITFPRVVGYRFDLPSDRLDATFTSEAFLALSTEYLPTTTENAPIVGTTSIHTLDDLKRQRLNAIAFVLARNVLTKYFSEDENNRPWLFPQLLGIAKRWISECVTLKANTFIQMLLLTEYMNDATDRIYHAIVKSVKGEPVLKPILRPYDPQGSTQWVDFDTIRPVYTTLAEKCHVSHVVADSNWEIKLAQVLDEEMDEVVRYVKNQNLGFTIPYSISGEGHQFTPDFILVIDDGHGDDLLNLIVEVSGENRKDKAAKVAAARNLWIPSINNHGGFGRWAFVEVTDPWDAPNTIRAVVRENATLHPLESL